MESALVSVIIPVFQSVKYLSMCIESVLKQTYKHIEVILIDDGSTDGSSLICDEYAQKYENIMVYHQRNSGVSVARNKGIDLANGQFLLFVDSDDLIHPELISQAIAYYESYSIELFLFGYQSIGANGIAKYKSFVPSMENGNYGRDEIRANILKWFNTSTLHAIGTKVYRIEMIRTNKIRFLEGWEYYEDIYFCLSYLYYCDSIYIYNSPLYYYRVDLEESLSKKTVDSASEAVSETFKLLKKIIGQEIEKEVIRKVYYKSFNEHLGYAINKSDISKKNETVKIDKYKSMFLMMNRWINNEIEHKRIQDYLLSKGYQKIAIYGMNYVGETLLKSLQETEIEVKYGIDKNADNIQSSIAVYSLEEDLAEVDAIIVTAIAYYDEVKEMLESKSYCKVISIEEIIYAL